MTEEPQLTEWQKNVLKESFQKFPGRLLVVPGNRIAEVETLVSMGLVKRTRSRTKKRTFYSGITPPDVPEALEMEPEQPPK